MPKCRTCKQECRSPSSSLTRSASGISSHANLDQVSGRLFGPSKEIMALEKNEVLPIVMLVTFGPMGEYSFITTTNACSQPVNVGRFHAGISLINKV